MPRVLLFISIAGILVCLWSALASVCRPTSFDMLTQAVDKAAASHDFSPAEKLDIDHQIQLVEAQHSAEVRSATTAYNIALGGLFFISVSLFIIYLFTSRKRAPNKSPEPTAVGAGSSAVAVHVTSRRWLSFFR
jgi:hypothetical protein